MVMTFYHLKVINILSDFKIIVCILCFLLRMRISTVIGIEILIFLTLIEIILFATSELNSQLQPWFSQNTSARATVSKFKFDDVNYSNKIGSCKSKNFLNKRESLARKVNTFLKRTTESQYIPIFLKDNATEVSTEEFIFKNPRPILHLKITNQSSDNNKQETQQRKPRKFKTFCSHKQTVKPLEPPVTDNPIFVKHNATEASTKEFIFKNPHPILHSTIYKQSDNTKQETQQTKPRKFNHFFSRKHTVTSLYINYEPQATDNTFFVKDNVTETSTEEFILKNPRPIFDSPISNQSSDNNKQETQQTKSRKIKNFFSQKHTVTSLHKNSKPQADDNAIFVKHNPIEVSTEEFIFKNPRPILHSTISNQSSENIKQETQQTKPRKFKNFFSRKQTVTTLFKNSEPPATDRFIKSSQTITFGTTPEGLKEMSKNVQVQTYVNNAPEIKTTHKISDTISHGEKFNNLNDLLKYLFKNKSALTHATSESRYVTNNRNEQNNNGTKTLEGFSTIVPIILNISSPSCFTNSKFATNVILNKTNKEISIVKNKKVTKIPEWKNHRTDVSNFVNKSINTSYLKSGYSTKSSISTLKSLNKCVKSGFRPSGEINGSVGGLSIYRQSKQQQSTLQNNSTKNYSNINKLQINELKAGNALVNCTNEMKCKSYSKTTVNSSAVTPPETKCKTRNFLKFLIPYEPVNNRHKQNCSNDYDKLKSSGKSVTEDADLLNSKLAIMTTLDIEMASNTTKQLQLECITLNVSSKGGKGRFLDLNKTRSTFSHHSLEDYKSATSSAILPNFAYLKKIFNLKRIVEQSSTQETIKSNYSLSSVHSKTENLNKLNLTASSLSTVSTDFITNGDMGCNINDSVQGRDYKTPSTSTKIGKLNSNLSNSIYTYTLMVSKNHLNCKTTLHGRKSTSKESGFCNITTNLPITSHIDPTYAELYETQLRPTTSKSVDKFHNAIKPKLFGNMFDIKHRFLKLKEKKDDEFHNCLRVNNYSENYYFQDGGTIATQANKKSLDKSIMTNYFQTQQTFKLKNGTSLPAHLNNNTLKNARLRPINGSAIESYCSKSFTKENSKITSVRLDKILRITKQTPTKKCHFKNIFGTYQESTSDKLLQTEYETVNITQSMRADVTSPSEEFRSLNFTKEEKGYTFSVSNSTETVTNKLSNIKKIIIDTLNKTDSSYKNSFDKGKRGKNLETRCKLKDLLNALDASNLKYIKTEEGTIIITDNRFCKCPNITNDSNVNKPVTIKSRVDLLNTTVEGNFVNTSNVESKYKTIKPKNKTNKILRYLLKHNMNASLNAEKQKQTKNIASLFKNYTNSTGIISKGNISIIATSHKHFKELMSNTTNNTLMQLEIADNFNLDKKKKKVNKPISSNLTSTNETPFHILGYVMKPIENLISIFRADSPSNFTKLIDLNTSNIKNGTLQSHMFPPNTSLMIVAINSTNDTTKEVHEQKDIGFIDLLSGWFHCIVETYDEPKAEDVHFYLYTRNNSDTAEEIILPKEILAKTNTEIPEPVFEGSSTTEPLVEKRKRQLEDGINFETLNPAKTGIQSKWFNILTETKILIHGYVQDYQTDVMVEMKDAYLTRGALNVIMVDWSLIGDNTCYPMVASKALLRVGRLVTRLLDELVLGGVSLASVHMVGFSLGAHVAGHAGSELNHGLVSRISGLDPALPYVPMDPDVSLDSGDAAFVDIIHSAAGYLGQPGPMGHVDFYPNGGSQQPGCDISSCQRQRSSSRAASRAPLQDSKTRFSSRDASRAPLQGQSRDPEAGLQAVYRYKTEGQDSQAGAHTEPPHMVKVRDPRAELQAELPHRVKGRDPQAGLQAEQSHKAKEGLEASSVGTCSHRRSALYFIESINSEVEFEATLCDSWHDFQQGLCNQSETIPMGDPCPTNASGKYYLLTGQKEPFALLPEEHVKVKKSLWLELFYDL